MLAFRGAEGSGQGNQKALQLEPRCPDRSGFPSCRPQEEHRHLQFQSRVAVTKLEIAEGYPDERTESAQQGELWHPHEESTKRGPAAEGYCFLMR